jgi:C-terminal processing protease CtpA/Prc
MFKPAVDRAMAPLRDSRALIIDMRRNGGGSPVGVSYLVSYFLDAGAEPVKINEFVWRNPGTETFRTEEFWSTPTPFSYAGKPVYVLTSNQTFSGGEEFAYDMEVMELAALVGETTGGGANPGGGVQLGSQLSMFMPAGRARNPITGTNWEGVGVSRHVDAPRDAALKVALGLLGETVVESEIDALSTDRLFQP